MGRIDSPPLPAFAVVSGAGVVYLGLTHVAFLAWRYWMPAVAVPLALAVGYSGAAMQSFLNEQREKRRLSRFFLARGGARDRA